MQQTCSFLSIYVKSPTERDVSVGLYNGLNWILDEPLHEVADDFIHVFDGHAEVGAGAFRIAATRVVIEV